VKAKPKTVLAALTVLWALFVAAEGISSIIRFWYSRKMGAAAKAMSGGVSYVKAALTVALAVSNVILFLGNYDGGDNE
jgi:uncharacterized membrane protein